VPGRYRSETLSVMETAPRISVQFILPPVGQHKLGGMEKVAAGLLNNLDQERFSGSLVCFSSDNGAIGHIDSPKVTAYVIEKRDGLDPILPIRLCHHFVKTRPDLVHTFNEGALIYAFLAAKVARVPALVHAEHGRLPVVEGALLRKVRIAMTRRADSVVVVSDVLSQVLREEGVADSRVSTVINGVDLTPFNGNKGRSVVRRSLGLAEDDWAVGAVGSLTPQKNHSMLIRAAAEVPGIKVLIAGSGPLEQSLNVLIRGLQVSDRVTCIGRLDDVPGFLGAMDMFALPSTTEGTSLALLEAMAASLPVVATDVGGNGQVVEDGQTGFLTPSNDTAALVKKLTICVNNRSASKVMGQNGRAKVVAKHDFSQTVVAYERVFERALGKRAVELSS